MSGGFFRGTSADQDTRFSNKQAKLLKSQKFASELEHTVDITKVKLDVIRPWIANRVTELLGFEDEVLINFIFGFLNGKDVDGKQIQIQLTGFMEKNTRKFMKELWSLLLSAQKNISGVPQQFLDAKEEEAKKKKAEADRISREIQQKRKRKIEKMSGRLKGSRVMKMMTQESSIMLLMPAQSTCYQMLPTFTLKIMKWADINCKDKRGLRSLQLRIVLLHFIETLHLPLGQGANHSQTPGAPQDLVPVKDLDQGAYQNHLGIKGDLLQLKSVHILQSPSPIRRRSPTPVQRRSLSPQYRKSPSFVRRRSPSPRWRSPYVRRRSPRVRQRLPSPSRHRSPSPPRRRSPRYHRRSPAPSYRSRDVEVSPYKRSRSRSPYPSQSPPHRGHTCRTLSKEPGKRDRASDRYQDEDEGHRPRGRRSPDVHSLESEKHSGGGWKAESSGRPLSTSLRSPQRDVMPQPEGPYRGQYKSPVYARKTDVSEDESERDQHGTRRPQVERQEIGDASRKANQHSHKVHDGSESLQATEFREHSPAALGANSSPGREDHLELSKSMKRGHSPRRDDGFSQDDYSNQPSRLSAHISEDIEYEPGRPEGDASQDHALVTQSSLRQHTRDDLSPEKALNGANMTSKRGHRTKKIDDDDYSLDYKRAVVKRSIKNVEHTRQVDTYESDDEENESSRHHSSDSRKQKKERIERKHKSHDHSDALSQDDERKEAKRRRKEEKKMQKEEKRRRHEERHRKREEQRAIKMKGRCDDADSREKNHKDGDISDGDGHEISHRSDAEEPELAPRNLEIELRKKALESLRAKKAISH